MEISLKIKGMHCNSCSILIEENLSELEGINSAVVSLESKTAKVDFDPDQVSEDTIKEIIERDGYRVE